MVDGIEHIETEIKPNVAECSLCGEEKDSSRVLHLHKTEGECLNACVGCVIRLYVYCIENKLEDPL